MHIPVLKKEVIDLLNIKPNQNFIDCTAGEAGHINEILKHNGPAGKILAFEWDSKMYQRLCGNIDKRVSLVNKSYVFLEETVKELDFGDVSGVLLDLGMSTWHIKKSKKGFSFQGKEPLDMRYDTNLFLTADEIVNNWKEKDIEKIIKDYSDERYAKKIAREIVNSRPLKYTEDLVNAIKRAVPQRYDFGRINPATRTFQALRITVNAELNNIKEVLPQAFRALKPGGRIVVISFHYLEDLEVEKFFKSENKLKIITNKPVAPSVAEIEENPSSRSAILRVAEKIDDK